MEKTASKINEAIVMYQQKLERKQRMLKPYKEVLNAGELLSDVKYVAYKTLEAEVNMLMDFINELRHIGE